MLGARVLRARAGAAVARPVARVPTMQFVRCQSDVATAPVSAAGSAVSPKISAIVDDISKLTILETSALVTELKTRLNIPDIAIPAGGAAAAPAAAAAPVEEEAAPVEEKTIFSVKLESFDAKAKPKIIKEVKSLLGLSLVESKKLVESAPKMLKDAVPKEDADKIKETIEALGGKITLE